MAGTGRKPFVSLDTVPYGVGNQRLKPPACLGELEKRAFVDLIGRVPLGQFQEADLPLICRWCELTVMAETAAGEMRAGGIVTDGKVSPWFSIYRDATRELRSLALRLRLGPQSRTSKAPKTLPTRMSYYERAALLEADDDEEALPS